MTDEQVRQARDLMANPLNTVSPIARLLGVSRSTIYKYVPALDEGAAVARPPQHLDLPAARNAVDRSDAGA
jgi:predicted transcriptional regulator